MPEVRSEFADRGGLQNSASPTLDVRCPECNLLATFLVQETGCRDGDSRPRHEWVRLDQSEACAEMTTFPIGSFVYSAYSPAKAGKVIAHLPRPMITNRLTGAQTPSRFEQVKVKWVRDGSTEELSTASLRSFDQLIKDTCKKLATHEAMLVRLQAL